MYAKVLMIAEIKLGSAPDTRDVVDRTLDRFREAVLPSLEHHITLYQATSEDLAAFASAGKLLPTPGHLWAEH